MEVAEEITYKLHTLLTLPLRGFIDCAVDGDLKKLVVEGEAPEDVLQAYWNDIQQDYSELLGGSETKLTLSLFKQLGRLKATLVQVYVCIDVLTRVYAKPYATELNALLRTRFVFNVQDEESYNSDLEGCAVRSKALELDISLKEQALEALQKEDAEKGERPSREYFVNVLISLSDYGKYRLMDDITVYEYCQRIKRLEQYITQLKSKHGK